MLVDTFHAALEHAVEAFHRVRVHSTTDILTGTVAGKIVACEVLLEAGILTGLIGHDERARSDVRLDQRQQVSGLSPVHMEGPATLAAFDQRQDSVLMSVAAMLRHVFFLADEGLVDFYDSALATHRREHATGHHRGTDTVRHEPCAFERDTKGTVKLVGADALLARAHQVHRLEPEVQRDVAALKYRAHLDGERLAAGVALVDADASAGALELADPLIALATRADRTLRPDARFDVGIGGLFVMEVQGAENGVGPR